MVVYVGLLRAVNVSGSGVVKMEALRATLTGMGLAGVHSLLQSGNIVFRAEERDAGRLERLLESRLAETLSLRTEVFLRSAGEWDRIMNRNPFAREADEAPAQLVVTALKDPPRPDAWRSLDAAIGGRERVRGDGRQAYIVYPDGIGRSRLTLGVIERQLGTRATSRNWNTVVRLGGAASSLA